MAESRIPLSRAPVLPVKSGEEANTRLLTSMIGTPQPALIASSLVALVVAMAVPFTPAGRWFGFEPPPLAVLGAIGMLSVCYLVCAELLKRVAVAPSAALAKNAALAKIGQ